MNESVDSMIRKYLGLLRGAWRKPVKFFFLWLDGPGGPRPPL
jgi:hypothetical protein